MAGIYERKRSRAAIWCQRFAVFLIPYFFLVILLYRFGRVETSQLLSLVALGFSVAILSLVLALRAAAELWYKGYKGGTAFVRGTFLSLLVLLPFGYYAYLALAFPLANDISTDTFNPPEYEFASNIRKNDERMNPIREYSDDYADTIILAYPRVQSRRYPAGSERVIQAVSAILGEKEWTVLGIRGIQEPDQGSEEELEDNNSQEQSAEESLSRPDDVFVEAVEKTLVFGFENDVVIRIVSENENTLVDVRSSSRWGEHDFGYNAKLIRGFLGQLDTALLGIAGEG